MDYVSLSLSSGWSVSAHARIMLVNQQDSRKTYCRGEHSTLHSGNDGDSDSSDGGGGDDDSRDGEDGDDDSSEGGDGDGDSSEGGDGDMIVMMMTVVMVIVVRVVMVRVTVIVVRLLHVSFPSSLASQISSTTTQLRRMTGASPTSWHGRQVINAHTVFITVM